jgi:hypothetical protein
MPGGRALTAISRTTRMRRSSLNSCTSFTAPWVLFPVASIETCAASGATASASIQKVLRQT